MPYRPPASLTARPLLLLPPLLEHLTLNPCPAARADQVFRGLRADEADPADDTGRRDCRRCTGPSRLPGATPVHADPLGTDTCLVPARVHGLGWPRTRRTACRIS